jgi:hypothetical protein
VARYYLLVVRESLKKKSILLSDIVKLEPARASSLLLRVRFSGFTNVFSLAMEDLISLLGGVVFATWMGLGTSSLG